MNNRLICIKFHLILLKTFHYSLILLCRQCLNMMKNNILLITLQTSGVYIIYTNDFDENAINTYNNNYDKEVTELEEKDMVFEQSLKIRNWDKFSGTITATNPEIYVNKKRRLSAREYVILQTFPDDFIFTGSLSSMYRQI